MTYKILTEHGYLMTNLIKRLSPITSGRSIANSHSACVPDNVEPIEDYRSGGFHPVHLRDTYATGRYRVLHKLGHGGFSAVWLARDELLRRPVSLKVIMADASKECAELEILKTLSKSSMEYPGRNYIMSVLDHFNIEGPTGSHACLVSQVAGPSVTQMSFSPGQTSGPRRLRGHIARLIPRQMAEAVGFLHAAGVVHGDLTTSNILLNLSGIEAWSDGDIYERIGQPVKHDLVDFVGDSPGEGPRRTPSYLVEPARLGDLSLKFLDLSILLVDFGESFHGSSPPFKKQPGTPLSYCSPEALFDGKLSTSSDVWALACILFEIRAGTQLFASFFGGTDEVLRQMVQTLGKLPEPWWLAWDNRYAYFGEDGKPKTSWPNDVALAVEYPLDAQIRDIGADDDNDDNNDDVMPDTDANLDEHSIIESPGTRVSDAEAIDLEDLLHMMLQYHPNDRLPVDHLLVHPWFSRAYNAD